MPNSDETITRLLRAVREDAADTSRQEIAFETRLMARFREERNGSVFAWAWKLAPFFAAVVLAVGVWNRPTTAHLNATASIMADAVREHPERLILSLTAREP
jgi:hypothetical protein